MKQVVIHSEEELHSVASILLSDFPEARLIAFYGEMGAGKTTFIKALCRNLGVHDPVVSPTFSIVNEYRTITNEPIYHFDFYRIQKLTEVYDIGYEEYFYSGHYCFLEWPELVSALLPDDTLKVTIVSEGDATQRVIEFPCTDK
jgi:tRNA threonylcarbamoyladenosine biosynthesis protein TsaE